MEAEDRRWFEEGGGPPIVQWSARLVGKWTGPAPVCVIHSMYVCMYACMHACMYIHRCYIYILYMYAYVTTVCIYI